MAACDSHGGTRGLTRPVVVVTLRENRAIWSGGCLRPFFCLHTPQFTAARLGDTPINPFMSVL